MSLSPTLAIAPIDDYLNTTFTTGIVIANGVSTPGLIEIAGDVDLFKIALTANVVYTFFANRVGAINAGGLDDPVLSLYTASLSTPKAYNNGSGIDKNATFSFTPTASANYFLRVKDYATGTGAYVVYVVAAGGVDSVAPSTLTFNPLSAAINVPINANIIVTFSEAIQRGTGSIVIRIGSSGGTIIETFDAATSTNISISGSVLTINPTSEFINSSHYFITFASGTIKDLIGNIWPGNSNYDFYTIPPADTTAPTIIVSSSVNSLKAGDIATITFTLSEASTNFLLNSVSVAGGVLTDFIGTGTVYTAVFTPLTNSIANGVVGVVNNSFTDIAGNFNIDGIEANNTVTLTIDTVLPTIIVTSDVTSLKAGETALITFTLSESSTDFTIEDMTVSGGSLSTFNNVNGLLYTAIFTPTVSSNADGVIVVENTKFTDAFGNKNADGSQANNNVTLLVDTLAPTTLSFSPIDGTTSILISDDIILTFSENIQRGDGSILIRMGSSSGTIIETINIATATNITISGSTLTINPTADLAYSTNYYVTFASGTIKDMAGNTWAGISTYDFTTASAPIIIYPTVIVSSNKTILLSGQTATITFTLSDTSINFLQSSITVTGGTLSSFTGSGAVYTATFTPTNNSVVNGVVSIASNSFTDLIGTFNIDGADTNNRVTIAVDTVIPRPLVFTPADNATAIAINANIVIIFNESIKRGTGNIYIRGNSATGVIVETINAATATNITISGSSFTLNPVSDFQNYTHYYVTFDAGSIKDISGNNYAGILTYDFTTIHVIATPTIAITSNMPSLKVGQTATITFTLSNITSDFTIDDITVSGGALSNFTENGLIYTATFTPAENSITNGVISVSSNKFTDGLGNSNTDGSDANNAIIITVDTIVPSIIVGTNSVNLKAGQTATIAFTLNKPTSNFTIDDITVLGGTISNFIGTGVDYTAVFTPNIDSNSSGTISVASNKFSDTLGTLNTDGADANNTVSLLIDTIIPTVAISSNVSSLGTGQTALITFTLSEPSTDFTNLDVVYSGGVLSNFAGSGANYTATFIPGVSSTANGVISIASDKFSDAAGNFNIDGSEPNNALTISINTVAMVIVPSIILSTNTSSLTVGQTATITFTLSESSTDFLIGDITVSGGTLGTLTGSGAVYTSVFTPPLGSTENGVISVASNKFSNATSNFNTDGADANNTVTITVNTIAPTIAITSSAASLIIGQTATITFTLSQSSTDFLLGDITVSGGTLGALSGSGALYTSVFTPTVQSTANGVINVASNKFSSLGNFNIDGADANNTVTITVNTTTPSIVITTSSASLIAGQTATITFTLSQSSTDFLIDDIAVSGGTLGALSGSGTSYTSVFTPTASSTTSGVISVASNKFSDAAGTFNTDGADANNTVTITVNTMPAPTIAITSSAASLIAGQTATITFTLSESSTDFLIGDITVSGGTLGTLSGSGTSYTSVFTPTVSSTTNGVISVASNKFSNSIGTFNIDGADANNTVTITVNTITPTIAITTSSASLLVGETATITFTLSESSTDFLIGDITVSGGTLSALSGSGTSYTSVFTPEVSSTTNGVIGVASNKFSNATGNFNTDGADANNTVTITVNTNIVTGPGVHTLWAWGEGSYGQLGQGDTIRRSSPVQVGAETDWTKISVSGNFSLATRADGTLWSWGQNTYGQLGQGTVINKSSPVQIGTGTNWNNISAGVISSGGIATKTDGTLWSWGYNIFGELGTNDKIFRSAPVQVGTGTNWDNISEGNNSSTATKTDGTLWTWGRNINGQLGKSDRIDRSSPVQIGAGTTWLNIASGFYHITATQTNGTLWSCGLNAYGQLGDGTVIARSSPVQVGAGTTWLKIASGQYQNIAKKTDGTIWAWGRNQYGQLGDGTTINRSSPVQVGAGTNWLNIATGSYNTIATKTDGTLWAWGYNRDGQLGQGDTVYRSSPVQIGAGTNWSICAIASTSYAIIITSIVPTIAITTSSASLLAGETATITFTLSQPSTNFLLSDVTVSGGTLSALSGSGAVYTSVFTPTASSIANGIIGVASNKFSNSVGDFNTDGADANNNLVLTVNTIITIPTIEGTLWSCGRNVWGQLGDGTSIDRSSPVQIGAGTTWLNIATGTYTTMATKTDGTLWSWGSNGNGQLGAGTIISRSSPVQVGTGTNWDKISEGAYFTMATKTDGTIWSWGQNNYGQLGDSTVIQRSSPVQIGTGTNWNNISAGTSSPIATKTDGTLWSWGRNNYGQLGDSTVIDRSSPVQIGTGTNWANAATSNSTTIATKTDGTLWSWGWNNQGQLGQGNIIDRSSPVQVGTGTTWLNIKTGSYTSIIAKKTDGTLWTWGQNNNGQLGDGTIINRSLPVQIGTGSSWSKISEGNGHTIATKTDGTLWTWGRNGYGQLGQNIGVTTYRSSPTQVGTGTTWANVSIGHQATVAINSNITLIPTIAITSSSALLFAGETAMITFTLSSASTDFLLSDITVSGGTLSALSGSGAVYTSVFTPPVLSTVDGVISVASNKFSNAAPIFNIDGTDANNRVTIAVNTTGTVSTLWSWGNNAYGQLGQGNTIYKSSPTQVGTGTTWAKISAGQYTQLATKTDGTLWALGLNNYGQLGDGTVINKSSPTQVGTGTTWKEIASGGQSHNVATKKDGTLWTWGYNAMGQLGDGTVIDRSSPVQIGIGTNWGRIACGYYNTLATKTDGTLWAWGWNNAGQLGLADTANRSSPVQIGTGTNWSNIGTGQYHTGATKTDGTLWTWGGNTNGQLGQNNLIYRSSPTQVGIGTTWSKIAGGGQFHIMSTKTDGTLWAWGRNAVGQLGINNIGNRSVPVQVGFESYSMISVGTYHSAATKTDGTIWAWGNNANGQLGQNNIISRSFPVQVGTGTTWREILCMGNHTIAINSPITIIVETDTPFIYSGQTSTIIFRLSQPFTDFTIDDVTVSGGTLSALSGSGKVYTSVFTPTASSTTNGVISVASDKFGDQAGSYNIDGADTNNTLTILVNTTIPAPTGQYALFFGGMGAAYYSQINRVSKFGNIAQDSTSVATGRGQLAAAGYGTDKAIFGFGTTAAAVSMTNLVSNTGVVGNDVTGVGTARSALAAAGYGTDKAIFGYGAIGAITSITNLVSNTGVVSTDVTGVGTARSGLAAAGYGGDKAIFGFGNNGTVNVSITNLVSNTGVVAANQVALTGTIRYSLAAAGYGGDKAIFGFGYGLAGALFMSNLVSNTGVVAADIVNSTLQGRGSPAATRYGIDTAVFAYGTSGSALSVSSLVSNTGVLAANISFVVGVTKRDNLAGASYG